MSENRTVQVGAQVGAPRAAGMSGRYLRGAREWRPAGPGGRSRLASRAQTWLDNSTELWHSGCRGRADVPGRAAAHL